MGRTSDARERLLASATELIHERGYTAVGVSDVCTAAGVNKGSFYHFFPSKQQLALDVIDTYWHDNRDFLEATLIGDEPPLDRLRRYFEALYARHRQGCALQGRQLGCLLGNLGLEMSTQDPRLRDRVAQALEAQIGYFERLLREARQRGDVPQDLDPRAAAEVLLALVEGKVLLSKLRDDPEPMKDLAAAALRLIGAETTTTTKTPSE